MTNADRRGRRRAARYGLTWLSAVATVALLALVLYRYFSMGDLSTLPSLRWNEMVDAAIQLQVSQASTLFQILLLVVAALVGLLIAKPNEPGLLWSHTPEIAMFICAAVLLLASLVFHLLFLDQVQAAYLDGGTLRVTGVQALPDPLSPGIHALFRSQRDCLIGGVTIAFLTLFSAHRLRE